MRTTFLVLLTMVLMACSTAEKVTAPLSKGVEKVTSNIKTASTKGYFNYTYEEASGKLFLEVDKLDTEFLYVNALAAGVGSNDIGLDRGQLGDTRIVKFVKAGPKLLLVQPNYDYRAVSDNAAERRSVEQAFAQSVLWGFKIESSTGGKHRIDMTKFLTRDAHNVVGRLKRTKQGSYKLDPSRSAIYSPMCKGFPKNTELEATLTFVGEPTGRYIRSVAPSADAITVRMHHSLIELPDDDYEPRVFDPRSGYNAMSYADYATPIQESLVKRFIPRHRLKKKNPSEAMGEPVEPIIYYVDSGAPEPVKSALIEGASWWNQAYEAAGYKNAFIVKEMPVDADPMDVRYNLIQWVHRSTRGWSYGSSVRDPRTGEIIKGHVSLGSLRVRQDFLIAQGLLSPYEEGAENPDDKMMQMALARLRQLSAHEVGHTLGLAHNFASNANDRASVMDYPHPYITVKDDGTLDFSEAYEVGIGEWDKRTIMYGYKDFAKEENEEAGLKAILAENNKMGLKYISDRDARPAYGAHPYAHLWDNGTSAAGELNRLLEVRKKALARFGENSIRDNAPMGTLEKVLVPLYLAHRYQVEGAVKVIGGVDYAYASKGDGQTVAKVVPADLQKEAFTSLMNTLDPINLSIPERILRLIPPQPMGYSRDRESFNIHTGITFDPIGAAEAAAGHTINMLLQHERLARIIEHHARDARQMSLNEFLSKMAVSINAKDGYTAMEQEIARAVEKIFFLRLLGLAASDHGNQQVNAVALLKINEMGELMARSGKSTSDSAEQAHYLYLLQKIAAFRMNPAQFKIPEAPELPDGSPIGTIGCGH